jgi:hypothetical protein
MTIQYSLYECQVDKLLHNFKQSTPRVQRKHLNDRSMMRLVFDKNREFTFTGTYDVIMEEMEWERNSSPIIFPENEHVINNLLNANFSVSTIDGLELPYRSFVMAMPKGYRYGNISIGSFLASFDKSIDSRKKKSEKFLNHYGLRVTRTESVKDNDPTTLTITYSDEGQLLNNIFSISGSLIPTLLNCNTFENFEKALQDSHMGIHIDRVDKRAYILLRLVLAVAVYDMATEHTRIVQGYPSNNIKDVKYVYPNITNKMVTLTAPKREEEADGLKMHYRTWYFRQLRADRYYQGEYEHHPKGSRYSFVSDTVVNRKVDAHTLIDESRDFI